MLATTSANGKIHLEDLWFRRMGYSDDERDFFRLLLKLARSPHGRKANSLFGAGAGLEETTRTVSQHFAGDIAAVRRFGYGAGALLDRFVRQGFISDRDVGAIMGAAYWPGQPQGTAGTGKEVSAFLLGAAALEAWDGNVALRANYRSDDTTALEVASWLGMAVARFEASGRTPAIPKGSDPREGAPKPTASRASHSRGGAAPGPSGMRSTRPTQPRLSEQPASASRPNKVCVDCGKENLFVRDTCYVCGGALRSSG